MDAQIQRAFQFLVEHHSFQRLVRDGAVSYQSETLVVTPTFNERDGYETYLDFQGHPSSRVAVGTILGALDVSAPGALDIQAAFLGSKLPALIEVPPAVQDDLCALRFWHAPQWRQDWGCSIKMDHSSVHAEKTRLVRVQQYFGKVPGATSGKGSRPTVV
jgi:hypothetical protein